MKEQAGAFTKRSSASLLPTGEFAGRRVRLKPTGEHPATFKTQNLAVMPIRADG